jgi:hypothetical protein
MYPLTKKNRNKFLFQIILFLNFHFKLNRLTIFLKATAYEKMFLNNFYHNFWFVLLIFAKENVSCFVSKYHQSIQNEKLPYKKL